MIPWFKIAVVAAGLLALVGAYHAIRQQGADGALVKIERQNNGAGNQADDARSAYDRCLDSGGLWNFGAGKCDGPSSRGGV